MIRPARPPTEEEVAQHYDELDALYRDVWGEELHHGLWRRPDESPEAAVENLTRMVAERVAVGPGDRVCDVGCGYGGTSRFLARRHGARVTGLTVSPVQHERARRLEGEGDDLRFLLRSFLDSGLPDQHFHAVVAVEIVSHVDEKPAFFREAWRTLRPGGRLVVAVWLAGQDPGRIQRRLLLEPICAEGRLPGLGNRAEYEGWLRSAGFDIMAFEDLSEGVRRTWTVCLRRVAGRLLRDRETRRYLLDSGATERAFGFSLVRIWLAYRTGALRYGLFTARR